jgi:hypothetical protein
VKVQARTGNRVFDQDRPEVERHAFSWVCCCNFDRDGVITASDKVRRRVSAVKIEILFLHVGEQGKLEDTGRKTSRLKFSNETAVNISKVGEHLVDQCTCGGVAWIVHYPDE